VPATTSTKQRYGLFIHAFSQFDGAPVVGNRDTSFASKPFWLFEDFLCIPPLWLLGLWYSVLLAEQAPVL
jgi:hypothetical protein